MKKFIPFLLLVVFGTTLLGAKSTDANISKPSEQTIVVSYEEMPIKLYKNQIFAIKLKAMLGTTGSATISYTASNEQGVKLLNQGTQFTPDSDGTFSLTLLYKTVSSKVRTPDFIVNFAGGSEKDANTIDGRTYDVLSPADSINSTGVIAQSLKVSNYKIDKYDNSNNILAIEVEGKLANLDNFKIKNIASQGTNKLKTTDKTSLLYYYVVIPNTQDSLEFQYFNTEKDQLQTQFLKLDLTNIEDKVSTQTDLSPKSRDKALYVFIVVSLIATILYAIYYFRREKIFLILIFAVIGSGFLFLFIPNEQAKIKKDCVVYLLPTESSTPFFKATQDDAVEMIKEADGFAKIKLKDGKIGWVRAECVGKN